MKYVLAGCFAMIASLGLAGKCPGQQPTYYDAFNVKNSTNMVLTYHIKWGDNGTWHSTTLNPGNQMIHFNPNPANGLRPYITWVRPSGPNTFQPGTWAGPHWIQPDRVTDVRQGRSCTLFWMPPTPGSPHVHASPGTLILERNNGPRAW